MFSLPFLRRLVVVTALVMLSAAPGALAKNTGSFSVGCLTNDTTLQTDEGVSNTTAPANVTVSPANLWPPNHKFRDMDIVMTLAAAVPSPGVDVSLQVNDITDDQVADDDASGHGCGKPTTKQGSDWEPTTFPFPSSPQTGTLESTSDQVSISGVELRDERCARDGTRTYTISVTCCDTTNAVCDSSPEELLVTVPKSKGQGKK
jgi:hypothetical protein